MALRPEIFISAAAPEMNACRKVVRQALNEIGARPVEHADFKIDYGPLHGVLMQAMGKCEAVIHIAGHQFGMEPAERTLHSPRRSFTHYELDIAQTLGIPIYTFASGRGCALLPYPPQDEEASQLQAELRAAYVSPQGGYHEIFSTPDELRRRIHALRSRLVVRRSLARLPSRPMGTRFIGRVRLIEEICQHLEPGSVHLLQPSHGLAPLGGSGTSTLAVELAWRLHDAGEKDFVFWLPAGAGADFEAALAALARTDSLSLLPDEVVSHRARLDAVAAWLRDPAHTGRFVFIVDGVDNETAWWSLKSYLPLFHLGSVIVTGRPHPWPGLLVHAVSAFSAEQVRDFFFNRLPPGKATAEPEMQALDRIAEALGRVPLPLELVAGHLRENGLSARELLPALLGRTSAGAQAELSDLVRMVEAALDESSRAVFRLLVCLAPEPAAIPLALFEGRGDWPITSAALHVLDRRGLVLRDESSRTLRVHRAVREVVRDRMRPDQLTEGLAAARSALDAALVRAAELHGGAVEAAELRELLIAHCRALLGQLNGHPLDLHSTPLARGLASWLADCGRTSEAEVFYRRALATEERRLGKDHPDVAPRLRELAAILRRRRQLSEAERLYRRALAFAERNRRDTAGLLHDLQNLAACVRARNQLREAEKLCRRVLEIEEQQFGDQHPRVAISLHRLAGVVEAAHRRAEAEGLYRRALEIDELTFGHDLPRLAHRYYHVAASLAQPQRDQAEELYRRGLAHEEKKLGPDHPDLAPVLGELAVLLEDAERPAEAEPLYRRVHHIQENHLGAQYSETAIAAANLAAFLHRQGRIEEALPLYRSAAEVLFRERARFRGPHPHIRSVLKSYAAALRHRGTPEEEIAVQITPFESPVPKREAPRWLDT
jgi:tetratricopeptide (TPR) repeat protein